MNKLHINNDQSNTENEGSSTFREDSRIDLSNINQEAGTSNLLELPQISN